MVLMVCIWKMGMDMHHRLVPVAVGVFFTRLYQEFMAVLMVLIMRMLMAMRHLFVCMLMLMLLSQVQPDTQRHQCACNQQRQRDLVSTQHGQDSAKERCD